jgi:hypothetical protein
VNRAGRPLVATRLGAVRLAAVRLAAAGMAAAGLIAGLAACSGGTPAATQPPTAKMERVGHGSALSVVLTPLGAARIAVRTAPAVIGKAATVIPYSALLYEPDGATAVYVNTGPLVYTRYYVPVASINGNQVYLKPGSLPAGARVVTTGAEELLGVQNGVGEET